MEEADNDQVAVHLPHHIQQALCTTRAPYRQGRKLTAVKVYTVNNESQHLLVYRVPAIKLQHELTVLCSNFGTVSRLNKLELVDPGEEFTDVYHVCYSKIREARRAKRGLDGRSFYGSPLHVCYAPELESVEETRLKLINRRNEIAYHTGRKMKVPNLSLKRPAITPAAHLSHKKLKLGTGMDQAPPVSGPSKSVRLASYGQPSTSSYIPNHNTQPAHESTSTDGHNTNSCHYQQPPTSYLPVIKPENGLGFADSSTGEIPALPGLYDIAHSYPSQEVLRLPGQEVKLARERKLTPSSVIKRVATTTPNRIVFHKKLKGTESI